MKRVQNVPLQGSSNSSIMGIPAIIMIIVLAVIAAMSMRQFASLHPLGIKGQSMIHYRIYSSLYYLPQKLKNFIVVAEDLGLLREHVGECFIAVQDYRKLVKN